jgi:hypothetical protein
MRKPSVSFRAEVTSHFQFLADQHHLDGPDYSDLLLPTVRYRGTGLIIAIHLQADTHDGAGKRISVSIRLDTPDGSTATAELGDLVEAAAFAPRHRVASKAHTGDALRDTLRDNANWVSRLLPILYGPGSLDTIRAATRHETGKGGNPKRRPQNIKWKYD